MTTSAKPASAKPAPTGAPPQREPGARAYWLLKSEPDCFSWGDLVARGAAGEPWTGVRNYQARNNMRAMLPGDLGFFYHSNIGKEIVGILRVVALAHPEAEDASGTWSCVDVEAVRPLPRPVTLAAVKSDPLLAMMALVTSMRLSVQPVTLAEWAHVCHLGGLSRRDQQKLLAWKSAGVHRATPVSKPRRGKPAEKLIV